MRNYNATALADWNKALASAIDQKTTVFLVAKTGILINKNYSLRDAE